MSHEIEANLRAHELIKIRLPGLDRVDRAALVTAICEAAGAQPVQEIGRIVVVYRARPADEQPKVKTRPRRKPARRTKRSYQNSS